MATKKLNKWDHCRACGALLNKFQDCQEGTLLESEEECPNGHYKYVFSYGVTELWIGTDHIAFSYTDTPEETIIRHETENDAWIRLRQEIWSKVRA